MFKYLSKLIIISTVILVLTSTIVLGDIVPCKDLTGNVHVIGYDASTDEYLDIEYFPLGSELYLNAQKFSPATGIVYWEIRDIEVQGKPVLASGSIVLNAVDSTGKGYTDSPVYIWTIPDDPYYHNRDLRLDAYHEFWASDCTGPNDNFMTVKDTFYGIPEFPVIALPVAIMLGLIFIITRNRYEP